MASDSRLTLDTSRQEGERAVIHLATGLSDSTYKTFLAPNQVGISTYGPAAVSGIPIAGYVESFISERVNSETQVDEVAALLLDRFKEVAEPPGPTFHVAGYKTEENTRVQHVWLVNLTFDEPKRVNLPSPQGATWGGEADIIARLVKPVWTEEEPQGRHQLPHYPIPWGFFTLQDAIDFAVYAVRSTIDSIRFQPRAKTVGGPIDVLVIKPYEAFWVQRKELHS